MEVHVQDGQCRSCDGSLMTSDLSFPFAFDNEELIVNPYVPNISALFSLYVLTLLSGKLNELGKKTKKLVSTSGHK